MNSRIAVVTGGLGAIGLATCRALAQANFKVIAADLPASQSRWDDIQMSMKNLNIHFEPVDVSDFRQCAQFVQQVESLHGPISALVNNAGITRDAVLKKMEPADWDAVISVNLTSVFNLCRQVVDGMSERGYGRRPSRSAPEHFTLLRLMLRTQPRSGDEVLDVWSLVLHWFLDVGAWSISNQQRAGATHDFAPTRCSSHARQSFFTG